MLKIIETALLALSGLVVAIAASWLLLASVNFSYPVWLDHAGVKEAIERYGPQNKFKTGFEKTSRDQRIDLFAGINKSIHSSGDGLKDLSFTVDGEPTQALLTESEVIHLQDVANLIDFAKLVALGALVVWFFIWGGLVYFRRPIPSLIKQVLVMVGVLAVVTIFAMVVGPIKVFYALHVLIFPEGHQWYYYYQESLMATMMYAPYLFGWIALELLVVTLVLCITFQSLGAHLASRMVKALNKTG